MMKPFMNTIEIHFWKWYIPLMSESSAFGELARKAYVLWQDRMLKVLLFQIVATILLGYLLGMGIGFAKASLP